MNLHAILVLYILLAASWWLFAWLYYDYRIDLLRYRLFIERDKLFLSAAEGKIGFDEPAYLMTRTALNGALRFAHRLTLSKFIFTALWLRQYKPMGGAQYHEKLKVAMQTLSFDQRKILLEAHLKLHLALLTHITHVSPLLFPFAIIFKAGISLHIWGARRLPKKARSELESIDAHVYDLGVQIG